jgi:hypothetical protein
MSWNYLVCLPVLYNMILRSCWNNFPKWLLLLLLLTNCKAKNILKDQNKDLYHLNICLYCLLISFFIVVVITPECKFHCGLTGRQLGMRKSMDSTNTTGIWMQVSPLLLTRGQYGAIWCLISIICKVSLRMSWDQCQAC